MISGTKISQLPVATVLQDTDYFPIQRGGSTNRISGLTLETATINAVRDTYPINNNINTFTISSANITLSGSQVNIRSNSVNISGTSVIETSSTSPALRITQTGSGDALVIEDSTNPDSTPFRIDSLGRVVVGSLSSIYGGKYEIYSDATVGPWIAFKKYGNDANPSYLALVKTRGTTPESNVTVTQNDDLGAIVFQGTDGNSNRVAATIASEVDGIPVSSLSSIPGRLVFGTTLSGGSTVSERMRITHDGKVGIGTTTPNHLLTVAGNVSANTVYAYLSGNAEVANNAIKWSTPRTLTLSGNILGNVSIDGTQDLTLNTTISSQTIDNSHISNNANIVDTKLAQITTPSKVVPIAIDPAGSSTGQVLMNIGGTTAWQTISSNSFVLLDGIITTPKLAPLAVTTEKIAEETITTAKLSGGIVTTVKIADFAVTNDKIADDAITTAKITNNAITSDKLVNDSVITSKLSAGVVTEEKIASSAVTNTKIANDAITTAKISYQAINTDKIAPDAITTDKLSAEAVTDNKIANGAITTAKILNNAVTYEKVVSYAAAIPNSVVSRDLSGNLSAVEVTADLKGNATTASALQSSVSIQLSGAVYGTASFNGSQNIVINTFEPQSQTVWGIYDANFLDVLSGTYTQGTSSSQSGDIIIQQTISSQSVRQKNHEYFVQQGNTLQITITSYEVNNIDISDLSYDYVASNLLTGTPLTATFSDVQPITGTYTILPSGSYIITNTDLNFTKGYSIVTITLTSVLTQYVSGYTDISLNEIYFPRPHSLVVGHIVNLQFLSGDSLDGNPYTLQPSGVYMVSDVIDDTTFIISPSTTIQAVSGQVFMPRCILRRNNGISNVAYVEPGKHILNFTYSFASPFYYGMVGNATSPELTGLFTSSIERNMSFDRQDFKNLGIRTILNDGSLKLYDFKKTHVVCFGER